MIESILFYLFGAIILFTALRMIFSRNIVHSLVNMVAAFVGIAFIYILLHADYLAVVQILIYVGAVSVMFTFGIMLSRRDNMDVSNPFNRFWPWAAVTALAFFALVCRIIVLTPVPAAQTSSGVDSVKAIAALLMNDYVIAFEAAGVLLLVALVGAIMLGKGVNHK